MTQLVDMLEQVRNGHKDESDLLKLACSNEIALLLEMARTPEVPERVLDFLSKHHSIVVKHAVAKNPGASVQTLTQMMQDKDMLVRDYAKRNLARKEQGKNLLEA